MNNLLVVDWDYFFVNPLESKSGDVNKWLLYDWLHNESQGLYHDWIWGTRAAGFTRNGLELPQMDQRWRKFADRFTLHEDAEILYADSNLWAGSQTEVGDGFDEVWLYDAHHDLYQYKNLQDWHDRVSDDGERFRITCEDWMFWHAYQGSRLVWRFPDWHDLWKEVADEDDLDIAKAVKLDYQMDDWEPVWTEFSSVFICRSGCWVPPWCDDEFDQFLLTWDRDTVQIGPNEDLTRTEWKETAHGLA